MALIDLQFEYLHMLFDILLKDKNTGKNIIWGTNDYRNRGEEYSDNSEITYETLNDLEVELLQPRVTKSKETQKGRTKDRAEVFTPSWVCEYMNNHCESDWIEKNKRKFNKDIGLVYEEFLKSYIDVRKLEITCGEAPFVVSRYDTTTGNLIPLYNRIGFLDKKLTAICHYIDNMDEWFEMICRAFESCYGYEYQGDNLFKARINLVQTFLDYYDKKWVRGFPSNMQLRRIANIVSRNFWQMDGLTYTAPNTDIKCKVYNWRSKKNMNLIGEGIMKFDYILGNPPYQDRTIGENDSYAPPIYDKFMDETYKIGEKVILITPARFLFNAGGTLKKWNEKMLNDEHFNVLKYEAKSKNVFSGVDIKGGVAITYRDATKKLGPIGLFTSFPELNTIKEKVWSVSEKGLNEIMTNRGLYRFSDLAYKEEPEELKKVSDPRISASVFEKMPKLFTDNKPKDSKEYIQIFGNGANNKRVYKWFRKDYMKEVENLYKYKVMIPKANGSGALGEGLSTPLVGVPLVGFTETYISIGESDNRNEIENILKYVKTKFARVLLGILKVTQSNPKEVWAYVPIQDFTENSDIDWSKSIKEIDQQLYKKYCLDENEIKFIEEKVKEME